MYVSGHPLQSCRRLIAEVSQAKVGDEYFPFSLDKIARRPPDDEKGDDGAEADDIPDVPQDAGTEDDVGEEETKSSLSQIDEMLMKCKDDDWLLKGLARNVVRAKGEVPYSDKHAFDKAVGAERAKLKKRFQQKKLDPLLLKRLEVRVVAMLSGCSVKIPKPRPDGSVGQKWAILALDDGNGQADAMAYAKAWQKCSDLEGRTDQLVLVCGDVSHRTVYEKEDAHRENPSVGEVSFQVREAYPLESAMPMVSKGLKVKMRYDDPELKSKMERLGEAARKNPGMLPVAVSFEYGDGTVVDVDLGPLGRVACSIGFLSELAKVAPQSDTGFSPEDKTTLAPPEPKPWEM